MNTRIVPSAIAENRMIEKKSYFKPEFVALEKERLWPRVWQMSCRVEEIPKIGDYVTYDIADESFIVVRTGSDRIAAYYNVCQHRGRRLTEGCGHTVKLQCKFHGWQWNLDGSNARVVDKADWAGTLDEVDLSLKAAKTDIWGGWVFINMDPNCEPLRDYLAPVTEILGPFELEKMRFRWRKWLKMPCNWKIALEAFNEGYHVKTTHLQIMRWSDDVSTSESYGRHSMFGYPEPSGVFGTGSRRLGTYVEDTRQNLADFYMYMKGALDSNMTDTMMKVAQRLPALPEGTPPEEVITALMTMAVEEDAKRGVPWPAIQLEQLVKAGTDWHIFPNMILLQMHTNCLGYRARPDGDNPDSCIFEVYQLERFPPGTEPKVENRRNDDIYDKSFWGEILLQDFQQMQETHRGVKSRAFVGPKTNPRQEAPVRNFHRVYQEYLSRPPKKDEIDG